MLPSGAISEQFDDQALRRCLLLPSRMQFNHSVEAEVPRDDQTDVDGD